MMRSRTHPFIEAGLVGVPLFVSEDPSRNTDRNNAKRDLYFATSCNIYTRYTYARRRQELKTCR